MSVAYIGIGSNLGDRQKNIDTAIEKLKQRRNIEVEKVSPVIETESEQAVEGGKFLNAACRLQTSLYPDELLDCLKSIEGEMGRRKDSSAPRVSREEQLKMLQEGSIDFKDFEKGISQDTDKQDPGPEVKGSRSIDLDVMFYDDIIMKGNNLIIPHPRLHERLFALRPLSEIGPDLIHPVLKKSIKELLQDLETPSANIGTDEPCCSETEDIPPQEAAQEVEANQDNEPTQADEGSQEL
ncbi:MAG: 2-amino-4-hydroxy-6-hydroxymethyldihydropteridine diphosphokinase [Candidatus Omnitrophica bacterium]|nr:2-amino-4-hydroxy-6-hydroxymethyldihydropteridine diphosphokinase [Candidatus Omnitrophota bacterium]